MAILSCSIADCERKSVCRGWCDMHYRRWKSHGDPLIVKPGNGQKQRGVTTEPAPIENQCAVEECTSAKKIRGWCIKHYKRSWRGYDPARGGARDDSAPCQTQGCEETVRIAGLCYSHYTRMVRHGDPLAGRKIAQRAMDNPDGTRTCTECGETKDITAYHRGDLYTLGRSPRCRLCCGKEAHARYEANQELYDEKAKAYRHKRRALMQATEFEHGLTRAKIREWHGDNCAYCGIEMDFNSRGRGFGARRATIEHKLPIVRGGGHIAENVTLCCMMCNSSKGSKTEHEFLAWRDACLPQGQAQLLGSGPEPKP